MNRLFDVFRGIFLGLANIIPGVSGGTMAVIFKIYDRLINGIADIYKHPIKITRALLYILIGILIGLIIGVFGISYLYETVPFITVLVFIGLIIGGLSPIYSNSKHNLYKPAGLSKVSLSFVLIVALPLIQQSNQIHTGVLYYLMLLICGVLVAIAMITPGISGSLILLIIGYYTHVIELIKDMIEYVVRFDTSMVISRIAPIFVIILGFILGAILFSKLIKWLLINQTVSFYQVVFGLLLGSPFAILYLLNETNPLLSTSFFEVVIGLILMLGAAWLSRAIIIKSENKESKTS